MAKFEIPRFRYVAQDMNGKINFMTTNPREHGNEWVGDDNFVMHFVGQENPNWRDTLIDLDVDDYDFDDGILRRIENDTTKN